MTITSFIKTFSLPIILLFTILYTLFMFSNSNSKLNQKITELETLNKVMKVENEKWAKYNDSLILVIKDNDAKLENMQKRDAQLYNKLQSLNTQITNLKDKYEKANNFTANYNADSVRQYFSDLE
jgi:peptidoglycan hydrolase CwlO-like protein